MKLSVNFISDLLQNLYGIYISSVTFLLATIPATETEQDTRATERVFLWVAKRCDGSISGCQQSNLLESYSPLLAARASRHRRGRRQFRK